MGINFHSKIEREALHLVARGDDRPGIIAEVTGFLEAEGLYVESIGFNLISPEQDKFAMELVAKGTARGVEKCHLGFEANWPGKREERRAAAIRWTRASMFHIGLNTPDRAGIVAAISKVVGAGGGSFVNLLGAIENSGDSAEGGTPYFSLRANVAAESSAAAKKLMEQLKGQGFGADLWTVSLDRPV